MHEYMALFLDTSLSQGQHTSVSLQKHLAHIFIHRHMLKSHKAQVQFPLRKIKDALHVFSHSARNAHCH